MIRLTIHTLPPSVNQLERMHWAVKKRLRMHYAKEIRYALYSQNYQLSSAFRIGHLPPRKIRLSVDIYWRTRRLDEDNAMGSLKIIIDAMRDIGLIYRDSPKWLTVEKPIQGIDRKYPRVEIQLEELP